MTKSVKVPLSVTSAGAAAANRYVGANATGAPTGGPFATGDWAIAQDGHLWICTAGGSPGTWADAGTAGGGTAANVVTSANPTANKLTVAASGAAPGSPSTGDLWVVSDLTSATAGAVSGMEIDSAEYTAFADVQAAGTVYADLDGLYLTIPPQSRPYQITFDAMVVFGTGTAASGSLQHVYASLNDFTSGSDVLYGFAAVPCVSTGTSKVFTGAIHITRHFPPNTVTRYYRIAVRQGVATIAGWSSAQLGGADTPSQGLYPPALLVARTL